MGTRTRLARSFYSAVLALGLLSLVFLGSPGCGCGEDNLRHEGGEPERCCCDFEWLPPRIANGSDVVISIENEDASLGATVAPSVLPSVSFTVPEEFTVCVSAEHLLGDSLDLVLRDQVTNAEYTRVALIYQTRCDPIIEPLSNYTNLTSTDCGEGVPLQCCCEFEWLPGPNVNTDVTITAENVSAGLNPVITPSAITDAASGQLELIDVCVDVDHPLGAQMDLVIREQGTNNLIGLAQLVYDARCMPTIVPTTAFPSLNITSTECGGEVLECCCNFRWLPPANYTGDVNLTAENVSPGLNVTITPNTINGVIPRTAYDFLVCINADHNLLDGFDLVITDTTGPELGRMRIVYRLRCDADIQSLPDTPTLILTTTDCGTEELQCCCNIQWNAPLATWIPPPGPWSASLESVDASLQTATITPPSIDVAPAIPSSIVFTVCVNPLHDLDAMLDIVLRSSGGVEFARFSLMYEVECIPFDYFSTGEGTWNILCQEPSKPGR